MVMYQPTGRPLAEPPMFNYEEFVHEVHIGSDARLRRLFAKDISLGYRWRDAMTDYELSYLHLEWARGVWIAEEVPERIDFYERLGNDLFEDTDLDLHGDILDQALKDGVVSHLAVWEYMFLDEDGGTTGIKRRLTEREDLFFRYDADNRLGVHLERQEAFKKYGYLAPPAFLAELKEVTEWHEVRYRPSRSEATSPGTEAEEGATSSHDSPAASPSEDASDPTARNQTATGDLMHGDFVPATSVSTASQPSSEHPLAAENAALKKRLAEFELENSVRKRQKQQEGTTETQRLKLKRTTAINWRRETERMVGQDCGLLLKRVCWETCSGLGFDLIVGFEGIFVWQSDF